MKIFKICSLIIISTWIMSASAVAGNFDGSKGLICSVMDVAECQPGGKCQEVSVEEVGIPYFFKINFEDKKINATQADGSKRVTDIERFEKVDNKVIIQGAEDGIEGVRDGVGWSMAIADRIR